MHRKERWGRATNALAGLLVVAASACKQGSSPSPAPVVKDAESMAAERARGERSEPASTAATLSAEDLALVRAAEANAHIDLPEEEDSVIYPVFAARFTSEIESRLHDAPAALLQLAQRSENPAAVAAALISMFEREAGVPPAWVSVLTARVKDPNPAISTVAASLAGLHHKPSRSKGVSPLDEPIPALHAALVDTCTNHPHIASRAAACGSALRRTRDMDDDAPYEAALLHALNDAPFVAASVLDAAPAGRWPQTERTFAKTLALFEHVEPVVRAQAVRRMHSFVRFDRELEIGNETRAFTTRARPMIMRLLNDPSPFVRANASFTATLLLRPPIDAIVRALDDAAKCTATLPLTWPGVEASKLQRFNYETAECTVGSRALTCLKLLAEGASKNRFHPPDDDNPKARAAVLAWIRAHRPLVEGPP